MTEWIGYIALAISLMSVNMTNMIKFRWLHLLASCFYLVYGLLIEATPLMIGASMFAIIHSYKLLKIYKIRW